MSRESARAVIAQALSQGRPNLTADEAGEICRAYGLPLPAERVASDAAAAAEAAREIGYPVASRSSPARSPTSPMPAPSPSVSTTTPRYATPTPASSPPQKPTTTSATIDGVLVQQMARPGREVNRRRRHRPHLRQGFVNVWPRRIFVETFKDVTFALAPTSPGRAREMLGRNPGCGHPFTASVARKTGRPRRHRRRHRDRLPARHRPSEIDELDLKPVIAYEEGVLAVGCAHRPSHH